MHLTLFRRSLLLSGLFVILPSSSFCPVVSLSMCDHTHPPIALMSACCCHFSFHHLQSLTCCSHGPKKKRAQTSMVVKHTGRENKAMLYERGGQNYDDLSVMFFTCLTNFTGTERVHTVSRPGWVTRTNKQFNGAMQTCRYRPRLRWQGCLLWGFLFWRWFGVTPRSRVIRVPLRRVLR